MIRTHDILYDGRVLLTLLTGTSVNLSLSDPLIFRCGQNPRCISQKTVWSNRLLN